MPGFPFQFASLFVRPNNREGSEKILKDSIPRGLIYQGPELEHVGLKSLFYRRKELCSTLFKQIVESDGQYKLADLLPTRNDNERYNFSNRWFSRYVIAAMLVDGKQKIAH